MALDLTEARTDGHAEIIAAGREGLRVLSGEEVQERGNEEDGHEPVQ